MKEPKKNPGIELARELTRTRQSDLDQALRMDQERRQTEESSKPEPPDVCLEDLIRITTNEVVVRRLRDLQDAPRKFAAWLRSNAGACASQERRQALLDAADCIENGRSIRLTAN